MPCSHHRRYQGKQWALARCCGCGLHFTSPTPSDDELRRFYANEYHQELRDDGETEAAFGTKYHRYADTLGRHLRSGRVVDVGCSTGLLVRVLRDRGYEAEGIELNAQSAAWGREHYRVPIHTQPLEHSVFSPRSLDAVLLTDVLEHTRHPGRFLQRVWELLVPGGYALVTFPDIGSLESRYQRTMARVFRRDWLWSTCHIPLHVWEFTRSTAEACFRNAGFRVVEFRRNHPPSSEQDSLAVTALNLPTRPLQWPAVARHLGTQMEFVIQKIDHDHGMRGTERNEQTR
jgi:SAM-dependent methyltransferase